MSEGSETASEFTQKKVDETWKDAVRREGEGRPETPKPVVPGPDFAAFVSTLALQALAALGELPRERDAEPTVDLPQAQYLIDTLQMLSDKTKGNLSEQETNEMNTLLYELRMKFVKKTQARG